MAKSVIPVYDADGKHHEDITLSEPVRYLDGRVCIGLHTGLYYKGVGIPYETHYMLQPTEQYEVIKHTGVDYLGFLVKKKVFEGLDGIIQEKYQSHFPDFIGACGAKELSMIEHGEEFKLSSAEVKKVVNWDKDHHHYYILLNYKCGRRKYADGGDPYALKSMLEYMIDNDWNFIWDKNCISDISYNGLVTDVADLFRSSDVGSKLGTVYSLFYSLAKFPEQYREFLNVLGYEHQNAMDFVFNSIRFLKSRGVDVSKLELDNQKAMYQNIVLNYLITGRNCAHCSYVELGDRVVEQYVSKTKKLFGVE